VVAPGFVKVDLNRKVVQHLEAASCARSACATATA
jgi:hypothetical protein